MENTQIQKQQSKVFDAKGLTITAMIAAVCIAATYIQVPAGSAMVHLGSAAVGSAIYDVIGGHMSVTLGTFFIKGIAGLLVGVLANSKGSRTLMTKLTANSSKSAAITLEVIKNLIAALAGAAWTLAGYLVVWTITLGSFKVALGNAIFSILTSAVGILVAIPLSLVLKKPLAKYINR